jgi:hypothetical protein
MISGSSSYVYTKSYSYPSLKMHPYKNAFSVHNGQYRDLTFHLAFW